ncbi:MAG TPA: inositol monophosphatase family protein [Planctomycetaceae bacterium]|nr:inositol monophosphatase family protein [Planctomycetaceae bacterium]
MSAADFLPTAEEAARAAGRVLEDWAGRFTVSEKSPANLVTEADFASQEAIHALIRERYPDHGFLGEEGLARTGRDAAYRWIIDPLDGTSNYVHRFPYYAVSIALEHAGELCVGVILDPTRDEMFAAVRGEGARLNGRPLRTSQIDRLEQTFAVASLPVAVRRDDPAVERFTRVLEKVQTVQRTGSAALNLAYVAAGRIDAYWSSSLKAWDMAAGALLVREAGGRVTRLDGSEFQLDQPEVLATNGMAIHNKLAQVLST